MRRRRNREDSTDTGGANRRGVLLAILLLIVLVGSGSAAGLIAAQSGGQGNTGSRRNTGVVPRTIDIWAVYPDDSLRMVSMYHPLAAEAGETAQIAGPLVSSEEAVTEHSVFGVDLEAVEYPAGPDNDAGLIYPLFIVQRRAGNAAYGADVTVSAAPYLTADSTTDGGRILSLGLKQPGYYQQMVVAVALPPGTVVTQTPDIEPYRQGRVAGWDVLYFDVTDADTARAIQLWFTFPADPSTPTLNWRRIDARR